MKTLDKIFTLLVSVLTMLAPSLKKADSEHGVKELTEAINGANEIAVLLCQRFSDGVDVSDFTHFWDKLKEDGEFKDKVEAAWKGYQLIPAEVKDTDVGEGLELAAAQLQYVPKYVAAFKKDGESSEATS